MTEQGDRHQSTTPTAGRALLEKYQDQPHVMAPFGARLLRSGMLYSAMGIIPMIFLMEWMKIGLARWVLGLP